MCHYIGRGVCMYNVCVTIKAEVYVCMYNLYNVCFTIKTVKLILLLEC